MQPGTMCTRGLPGLALLVVAVTSLPGLRPAAPPSLR